MRRWHTHSDRQKSKTARRCDQFHGKEAQRQPNWQEKECGHHQDAREQENSS